MKPTCFAEGTWQDYFCKSPLHWREHGHPLAVWAALGSLLPHHWGFLTTELIPWTSSPRPPAVRTCPLLRSSDSSFKCQPRRLRLCIDITFPVHSSSSVEPGALEWGRGCAGRRGRQGRAGAAGAPHRSCSLFLGHDSPPVVVIFTQTSAQRLPQLFSLRGKSSSTCQY